MSKHICNPKTIDFFGIPQYQCGCGRYFGERSAIEQREKYKEHISNELKEKDKKDG